MFPQSQILLMVAIHIKLFIALANIFKLFYVHHEHLLTVIWLRAS